MGEISAYTQTTVEEEGGTKTFNVSVHNIENGNIVLLALYKSNKLMGISKQIYDTESNVSFKTNIDYDSAKIMVWETMLNMRPVCPVEKK